MAHSTRSRAARTLTALSAAVMLAALTACVTTDDEPAESSSVSDAPEASTEPSAEATPEESADETSGDAIEAAPVGDAPLCTADQIGGLSGTEGLPGVETGGEATFAPAGALEGLDVICTYSASFNGAGVSMAFVRGGQPSIDSIATNLEKVLGTAPQAQAGMVMAQQDNATTVVGPYSTLAPTGTGIEGEDSANVVVAMTTYAG